MFAEGSPAGEPDSSTDGDTDSSNECPTCGDEFKNKDGVKIHHQKIHNESIAGVEVDCDWCGETLVRKEYRLEKFDNQFCDMDCKGDYRDEHFEGENAPRWKGGEVTKECGICGDAFKSRPNRNKRFCSRECQGKHTSKVNSGEGHPNWKGGHDHYYGNNWSRQRDRARERDGYECHICGVNEEELGRQLDVHHITPLRKFDTTKRANELNNLVSLCQSCHHQWEGIPLRPQ